MCGITGILRSDRAVHKSEIEALGAAVSHRGPDGSGVWLHNNVALAHHRLAIIDPGGGPQPMVNHRSSLAISYNGEIYNYLELRRELQQLGYPFVTQSDTEVVLAAYDIWGQNCLSRLRGMFSLAIVDLERKHLFLARDHFGIKPLYYRAEKDRFSFASELLALRIGETSTPEGDVQSINYYLRHQFIPAPHTIYKNVHKLPPAHFLTVDFNGKVSEPIRYWHTKEYEPLLLDDQEWVERVDAAVKESVEKHLVSDVPYGVFLSGGVDSTFIAKAMSEIENKEIKAFSVGFEEQPYSELEHATLVADDLQLTHFTKIVTEDIFDLLPKMVSHCGEPFGDSSVLPSWYLSELASQEVSMVLSGDGGDEAFGGYNSYQSWMDQGLDSGTAIEKLACWQETTCYYNIKQREQLWKPEYHESADIDCDTYINAMRLADHSDHLRVAQAMDYQTYLPNDILHKMDIASMYHGLEVRTPFTDLKVFELAAQTPVSQRLRKKNGQWQSKYVLKKCLEGSFPEQFVHRKKQGFSIPRDKWLEPDSRGGILAREVILDSRICKQFFNQDEMHNILERQQNERGHLWLLLVLGLWEDCNGDVKFSG